MMNALLSYINGMIYAQPPPNALYGYEWQAGQGVPARLDIYDPATLGTGIYVGFGAQHLATAVDPFGRGPGGVGTVFPAPASPSAALTALIARVLRHPPPDVGYLFRHVTTQRLADLTGFLAYVAKCLDILNETAAGRNLLGEIRRAGRPWTVIMTSSAGGNQTFAGVTGLVNALVAALRDYGGRQGLNTAAVRGMVDARYHHLRGQLARYNQLAQDMNNAPLNTLFVAENAFPPRFLYSYFRFRGLRFTGQNLMNWLSPGGFAAFDANVRTFAREQNGVLVREYFLLAFSIALYAAAPAGPGTPARILFNTRNEGDNVLGSPGFRPPAVGLGHELVHAMHYGRGTAAGYDFGGYTTTAAELLFVGLGPFATEPITENAIRGQWATIPPGSLDPSNVWAAPGRRDIYDAPGPGKTPADLRASYHVI